MVRFIVAVLLLLGAQGARDAAGSIKVPDSHPRILFTRSDLDGLRERIKAVPFDAAWRQLESEAGQLSSIDPKNPIAGGLQVGSHTLSARVATAAFHAVVSGEAGSAERLNAFFEALDVSGVEKQLPANEFMPHGEFLYGLAVAYDWGHSVLSAKAKANLEGIVRRRGAAIFAAMSGKTTWEASIEANNHSMACCGPLGLAGLALWSEEPKAKEWVDHAARKVKAYVEQSFDEDGAGYEGNLYGPFGLEMALPFAAAVKKLGGAELLEEKRVRAAIKWVVTDTLPSGAKYNPLNDTSGGATWANVPLYAAAMWKDGLARWFDENRKVPSVVLPWRPYRILWDARAAESSAPGADLLVRHHRGRGLVNVRTSWESDAVFASFECGQRRNGCHGQGDQGQFTLYAGAAEFAIDMGYSNEPAEGTANQSVGHNLVLIDGKGERLCGGGKVVEAKMTSFQADDVLVAAIADLAPAYNADGYNAVSSATRAFLWIRTAGRPYVIVIDWIAKPGGKHKYESLLHTAPGNEVGWEGASATITASGVKLSVKVAATSPLKTETRKMKFDRASVGEHPVLVASSEAASWFAATVLSFDNVEVTTEAKNGALIVKAKHGEASDVISVTAGFKMAVTRTEGGKKKYEKKV